MDERLDGLGSILTAHLLPEIEAKLVELLRSLRPEEWERQTVAPQWTVKQVAAHLLDTHLRKLSMVRDGYFAESPVIRSADDLAAFINRINANGVAFYGRLSAPVLISLMETAARESAAFHQLLDPFAKAAFSVSWAGEDTSLNWFDTARELSERWHHQQQIRLATGREGIMTRELYHPVLDCFLRALPRRYRDISASAGTVVRVEVSGDCGGTWFLYRDAECWSLVRGPLNEAAARVTIPQEIAWRLFTKGIGQAEAAGQIAIEGDTVLGQHVVGMTSIVA